MTGTQYREIREAMGLTVEQLADRLGVTRQTIYRREAAKMITTESEIAIKAIQPKKGGKKP